MQVHFEAKRNGRRGQTEEGLPRRRQSSAERWPTLIPLVLLIGILVSGRTPDRAAFTGIGSFAIVGAVTRERGNTAVNWVLLAVLHAVLLMLVFGSIPGAGNELAIFGVAVLATVAGARAFGTGAKWALAVGAAAGRVGSDPLGTGKAAFRLGPAKALVPLVFAFSPALLIVTEGFTLYDFSNTFVGCVLGITLLAAVLSKSFLVEMTRAGQLLCVAGALPMLMRQLAAWRRLQEA